MKKAVVLVLAVITLVFTGFSPVFAVPSSMPDSSDEVVAPARIPPWAVYEERTASGEVWYAYAKATVRQFRPVGTGSKVFLTNARGETFQAEVVKILYPLAASDPRNPTRVWIEFKSLTITKDQSCPDIAVVFKKWGWPPL